MQCMFSISKATSATLAAALMFFCASSCTTPADKVASSSEGDSKSGLDVGYLLSMSFEEAGAISGSRGEVPGVARVAADSIEVLRFGKEGDMRRLRARGNVFVEMDGGGQPARALAQEAYITESEVILRGMPALQRGAGLLEGLTEKTIFYIFGSQVRALGRHRINSSMPLPTSSTDEAEVLAVMRSQLGKPPKLPEAGPWRAGPNPLLPPLDESAVPDSVKEELRRQAEAEAVLQQSRSDASRLPDAPLDLPPPSSPSPPAAPPAPAPAVE